MQNPDSESVDALADVLKTIRLSAEIYFCSDYQAPWDMDVPKSPKGQFHAVVEGACYLKVESGETMLLECGDIVAFPTGGEHWISDSVKDQIQSVSAKTTLLCGTFSYDNNIHHPFLKDLPCFIRVNARESNQHAWLHTLIQTLANESRFPSPGASIMVNRLTEVLFIQIMRAYMQQANKNSGYFSALMDAQIGKALNLIHGESHAHWSVERLSDAVALSRSAFTEKFTKMVGEAPKTYLTNVRMQKAKDKLRIGKDNMISIAEAAGYSSEAAFSKAFKKIFAVTPGSIRRLS